MASKVMVQLAVAPFAQVNKSKSGNVNSELVLANRNNNTADTQQNSSRGMDTPKTLDNSRVAQLEQNIRFLQEQHQLMLAGLHTEIESLKTRNRELQFQLVFTKGSIPSSPSSPEVDSNPKPYVSPNGTNSTPLQVEILEKELGELKIHLQETESQNAYLSAVVEEQKRKLERYEKDEKDRDQKPGKLAEEEEAELLKKLEDAEAVIRRLRRENSDLRRECSQQYQRENGHQQRRDQNGYQSPRPNNQGRGNRGYRGQHNRGNNWFPPLHSQSFWQGGRVQHERGPSSAEASGNQLPTLQDADIGSAQQHYHQGGRRGSNNNHHYDGGRNKYRGGPKGGKNT